MLRKEKSAAASSERGGQSNDDVHEVERMSPRTEVASSKGQGKWHMLNTVLVRGPEHVLDEEKVGVAGSNVGDLSLRTHSPLMLSQPFVASLRESMLRRVVAEGQKAALHLSTTSGVLQDQSLSRFARLAVLQRVTRAQLVGAYKALKADASSSGDVGAGVNVAVEAVETQPMEVDDGAGSTGRTGTPKVTSPAARESDGFHILQMRGLPGVVPYEKAFRLKRQHKRHAKMLDKIFQDEKRKQYYTRKRAVVELNRCVAAHREEFVRYHKNKRTELKRLSAIVEQRQTTIDMKREREETKSEMRRLQALRENDMEAYTRLVSETKNERLRYLLNETDSYIETIAKLIGKEQDKVNDEEGQHDSSSSMSSSSSSSPSSSAANPQRGKASEVAQKYYTKTHKKMENVVQPSLLKGGDLKEYQLAGLQWMVSLYNNNLNGILADEMGLGKTIQTIALLTYVMEYKHNKGPFLVVVPLSTLSNWVNETVRWAPDIIKVVYKGSPETRKNLFKDEVEGGDFNLLLTTYEYVMKDKSQLKRLEWQYIIVDEGHRMKNQQSKFAQILGTVYQSKHRILLTGTPLQNNLPELWALLNFLLPNIFSSMDTFDQWFNKPFAAFRTQAATDARFKEDEAVDGTEAEANLSNEERLLIVHRLHEVLRPFMLRRVKDQVLDQLPEKTEMVLKCELSTWQKDLYKAIADKGLAHKEGRDGITGLNNVVMQLRKVCNHPYLFIKEWFVDEALVRAAGKFELLDRILPKLYKAGHRVLMFSQMTQLLTILERYFELRNFAHLRLDGGTSSEEREKRMYMFNDPDSPYFVFLLSTRAGGLGLNLATADTVILFDSDWNPMMDAQAQDRAHRIGQKNEVRVFRLVTASPIEERILSRATDKRTLNGLVIESGEFNKSRKSSDKDDQKEIMESLLNEWAEGGGDTEIEVNLEATDIPRDDEINKMMATCPEELALYEQIDRDRTATRQKWWDEEHLGKGITAAEVPPLPGPLMLPAEVPKWIDGSSWHGRQAMIFLGVAGTEGALEYLDTGEDEVDADIEAGRPRKRKDVVYDDNLTEQQFMRMMERQAEEQADREEQEKSEKKADLKRRKMEALMKADAEEAARIAAAEGYEPLDYKLQRAVQRILNDIQKIERADGGVGLVSELFRLRPSKELYPDYYKVIKDVISFRCIEKKLKAGDYPDLDSVDVDMEKLCENARIYNSPDSIVYEDSEVIKLEWRRRLALVREGTDISLTMKHVGRPPKNAKIAKEKAKASGPKKPRGRPKGSTKKAKAEAEAKAQAEAEADGDEEKGVEVMSEGEGGGATVEDDSAGAMGDETIPMETE